MLRVTLQIEAYTAPNIDIISAFLALKAHRNIFKTLLHLSSAHCLTKTANQMQQNVWLAQNIGRGVKYLKYARA